MAAVDDADGKVVSAFFTESETSAAYLRLLQGALRRWGIPQSIYQDRHGALRRNDGFWSLEEQLAGEQTPTQVGQALGELGIRPIFARCPQGKGRIERFFGVERGLPNVPVFELDYHAGGVPASQLRARPPPATTTLDCARRCVRRMPSVS